MTHDPMRQADIERRLSNLAKARRCGARSRAGHLGAEILASPTRAVPVREWGREAAAWL
jgi:hypothetical protein